jgi:iron complex transport system ATP-binding protein
MNHDPLLECRNLTINRGDKRVLDRLTLAIQHLEHTAIIGPNGCGKTTLIRTITRDFYPMLHDTDWTLRIMGRDRWHVFELRSLLGIVNNDLVGSCTCSFPAREIILSGFFSSVGVWPHHIVEPHMESKVDEVMALLEIEHLADRPTNELSSGEAHRVVIGRALVNDPQALVLDEPSTSLDLRATRELRDLMRKLAAAGKTIILVTHHLPDLIPEMRRVILMKDGKVFRDGPTAEVLTSAHLSELFALPLEVVEREGYYNLW